MNNCNAEFTGGINIGNTYFFAVNLNMAFIRLVDAAHHFDDGRFAGTVLTEKYMDFTRFHFNRDIVHYLGASKYLGDTDKR